MIIDVTDLVGKPFLHCGRGPDAYDCFGLVLEVLRRVGIDWDWPLARAFEQGDTETLSGIIMAAVVSGPWELVEPPLTCGDVLVMATDGRWSHVAPMVTDKHCLHITKTSTGAHLTSPEMLTRVGYRHQEVYRWRG